MKQCIAVVNRTIPFGNALNALAHTALGVGCQTIGNSTPNMKVFFADAEHIRAVRSKIYHAQKEFPGMIVFSNFINTMTGGDTESQIALTRETPETELIYYAITFCADEQFIESSGIKQLLDQCLVIKEYEPIISSGEDAIQFRDRQLADDGQPEARKISLVLDRSIPIYELINGVIYSAFVLGRKTSFEALRMITYVDGSGEHHPYISYHALPILAAKKSGKFAQMVQQMEQDSTVDTAVAYKADGNPMALCAIGLQQDIDRYSYQRFISLWNYELPQDSFNQDTQ